MFYNEIWKQTFPWKTSILSLLSFRLDESGGSGEEAVDLVVQVYMFVFLDRQDCYKGQSFDFLNSSSCTAAATSEQRVI